MLKDYLAEELGSFLTGMMRVGMSSRIIILYPIFFYMIDDQSYEKLNQRKASITIAYKR